MRRMAQPPPEKPWPNEPKPPRVTPPATDGDDVVEDEWLVESPLKKLDRDQPCELPWPPDELLLQLVLVCAWSVVPAGGGSHL
jgi:hypothetical protein